ncbi:MAG: dockerin type I repeat-containing protein, partial [Ruminococcus sp.]|nr:dockerin type I repeat-containing protein [Ruminococcus sp.]
HYFYPVIQNFEVTYNINTGTQVEYLGGRTFRNDTTVDKIKSGDIVSFDYFEEYDTETLCKINGYYTLASCTVDSDMFFTYFDYGYESETKKDNSVFCLETPYSTDDRAGSYISVSGNAEITDTFYGGSYIDGNLECGTDDVVTYTTIEPTSDGFVEIYCPAVLPMFSIILNVANGKFIPTYSTIGCVMPETCDLNMDGYINISDAVIFQKYMLGKTKLTSIQYSCADMNYDGSVDVFDMVLVRQKVIEDNHTGLIPEPIKTIYQENY